jgi:hypothetical protein
LVPTAPAILNAIHDAVGVRITSLPATAEKVLAAIKAAREGSTRVIASEAKQSPPERRIAEIASSLHSSQ